MFPAFVGRAFFIRCVKAPHLFRIRIRILHRTRIRILGHVLSETYVIEGTFALIEGISALIQGTFALLEGIFGLIQGTLAAGVHSLCGAGRRGARQVLHRYRRDGAPVQQAGAGAC